MTMYLSRISLKSDNRKTMLALTSLNRFHQALENCFPLGRMRNLWRIDSLNDKLYLLILSSIKPDFTSFCKEFSEKENDWKTKDYSVLLNKIENDTLWKFRLTANPTISLSQKHKAKHGRVHAHITTDFQKEWLQKRCEKHGFNVQYDDFDVVQSRWLIFKKRDNNLVRILSVTFEGVLKVTNSEAFCEMLTKGIGRGKAYGLGLMTVIHV